MRFVLTGVLLALAGTFGWSQTFTPDQVREDLRFLISQMDTYNPALHTYNPDFRQQADSLVQSAENERSLFEYFKLVTRVVALGNEGHYGVGNWTDTIHQGFMNGQYRYLPLTVQVLDSRLYVWLDLTEKPSLKQGDEILSINGMKTAAVLETLSRYVTTDGQIPSNLESRLTAALPWKYYLYIDQPEQFELRVRSYPDGAEKTVTIPAITRPEMVANYQKNNKPDSGKPEPAGGASEVYTFDIRDGVAWLHLKTFNYDLLKKHKLKSGKLYKSIFNQLADQKIRNLVIDLRDNGGGRNEFAEDMIPYILKKNQEGAYRTSLSWEGKKAEHRLPKQHKLAFTGNIYTLINGGTYSSGASLARYLREYGDAITIGAEGGTRYEGFVAGSSQYVNLPNSGLRIGIPRYQTAFPVSTKQTTTNRGLLPDHPVRYTIDELIRKEDKEMELARKLIGQEKGDK